MGIVSWYERFKASVRGTGSVARMIPGWKAARPLPRPNDYFSFADQGYRKNTIIFACVSLNANAIGEPKPKLINVQTDEELDRLHPAMQLLNRPNPYMGWRQFSRLLQTHRFVSGNAYVEKIRSGLGVVEMHLLRPDRVKIKVNTNGEVEHYRYEFNESDYRIVEADNVVHIPYCDDPLDDFYGLSPIAVAMRAADLDNESVDFLRAYFLNGHPKAIIKLTRKVQREIREEIKQQWREEYSGVTGFHGVAVLDQDADYKPIGSDPGELALDSVFGESGSRICMVFRTPTVLIGTTIGLARSTFSNYAEARRSWWEDTVIPDLEFVSDKLTSGLIADFGEGIELRLDMSKVTALQENQDTRWTRATGAWTSNLLRLNEARKELGLDAIEGGDDVFFNDMTTGSTQAIGPKEKPANQPALPPGPEAQRKFLIGGFDEGQGHEGRQRQGRQGLLGERLRAGRLGQPEEGEEVEVPFQFARRARALGPRATIQLADEAAPVIAAPLLSGMTMARGRLSVVAAEKKLTDKSAPEKVALASYRDLPKRYTSACGNAMAGLYMRVFAATMAAAGEEHAKPKVPAAVLKEAARKAKGRVAKRVKSVNASTRKAIQEIVASAYEKNEDPRSTAKKIQGRIGLLPKQSAAIDKLKADLKKKGLPARTITARARAAEKKALQARALNIAENEAVRMASLAQDAAWKLLQKQGKLKGEYVRWVALGDERVCPTCSKLNGEVVKLGEAFGGMYYAPPDPHPSCRCGREIVSSPRG